MIEFRMEEHLSFLDEKNSCEERQTIAQWPELSIILSGGPSVKVCKTFWESVQGNKQATIDKRNQELAFRLKFSFNARISNSKRVGQLAKRQTV